MAMSCYRSEPDSKKGEGQAAVENQVIIQDESIRNNTLQHKRRMRKRGNNNRNTKNRMERMEKVRKNIEYWKDTINENDNMQILKREQKTKCTYKPKHEIEWWGDQI